MMYARCWPVIRVSRWMVGCCYFMVGRQQSAMHGCLGLGAEVIVRSTWIGLHRGTIARVGYRQVCKGLRMLVDEAIVVIVNVFDLGFSQLSFLNRQIHVEHAEHLQKLQLAAGPNEQWPGGFGEEL
jgi:hypothetical protein